MKTEIIMHQRLLAPFSLLFLILVACSLPFTSGESDAPDIITLEDLQGCYYAENYHEDSVYHYYADSIQVSYPTDSAVFSDTIQNSIECKRICFEQNIKRTFNKEYQYRWNVKYPNVKKLHYQTETVGSGSLTILEPSTKIIDIQQPGTYDYNVALGGGDTTYTIEGNQRGPSSVSGWLVFKKFSVRNGIKYLDEYSSEGWTLCEE
jgi:hypothetical protein